MNNVSGSAATSPAKGRLLTPHANSEPSNGRVSGIDLLMRTDSALDRLLKEPTTAQTLRGEQVQAGDSIVMGFQQNTGFAGTETMWSDVPSMGSSNSASKPEPLLIAGAVEPRIPTTEELGGAATRAQSRLAYGDRAGAYLELYQVTGNEQLLLQAQITTYAGAVGGMAIEGNFRAKMANPDAYKITLDKFSHDIDLAVVELARDVADEGQPEEFNKLNIIFADSEVWADNDMAMHFPGNAQLIGVAGMEHLAQSIGSEEAILTQDEIELGRRPAEFANDPDYVIEVSQDDRFTTVINKQTNRIELFYDKHFESDRGEAIDGVFTPDLEQVDNERPSARIATERQLKMEFLQAGTFQKPEELPAFDENAPRPPENLDRVFKFGDKLYQVSDRQLFENRGVNFQNLTKTGPGQLWEGLKFMGLLNEVGNDVEQFIGDRNVWSESEQNEDLDNETLQNYLKEGSIVPLTHEETLYYQTAMQSLRGPLYDSPYQSTDDAMKTLRSTLWHLGENSPMISDTEVALGINTTEPYPGSPEVNRL